MGRDHITIGMMRDNTMYRQYHHEESPHKWMDMLAERLGRGYPEGVILSKGQG